jgi:polysaccharide chain length determinant protein (PEP-CTERM system associated)
MIENRELTLDDYLAILRRRSKLILIPVVLAPLAGFLISYAFPAKYTSQSLILVEGQRVPENMVQPVVSEDLSSRVATLKQQVLSLSELQPMLERVQFAKGERNPGEIMDEIRANMTVSPVVTDLSEIGGKKRTGQPNSVPGFYVNYTASNPREAQQICNELTSLMVQENLRSIQSAATGTSNVLNKGIDDAKSNLTQMDAKFAAFKKQYVGQLPADEEDNLKILTGLNSQLDANTQTLNRAQQDKTYTESMLAQQVAAWKSSQTSTNPETLRKQMSDLQAQLLDLQARYTPDHPDVIKTKADIAEVKKKVAEVEVSAEPLDAASDKGSANEPPEIRQMRVQVHQYEDLIAAATRDQKTLQQKIAKYERRVSLSPAVEEQYKELTRDYDNANKTYQDLLAKKSTADLTIRMNNQSQGERMFPLDPASLPDAPSFPNRALFAGSGLGVGLAIGLGLCFWLELRDSAIRTVGDAEAVLDLPTLVAVPWVGAEVPESMYGKLNLWKRIKGPKEPKAAIGA